MNRLLYRLTLAALPLVIAACNANAGFAPTATASNATHASVRAARSTLVLYSFKGGTDGDDPLATLNVDSSGALYGTTAFGGGGGCFEGCGTVFKLTPAHGSYVESVLYSFQGSNDGDGAGPAAGVIFGPDGGLYGTTEYGGDSAGNGSVFKLAPAGSKYVETVLYRFSGGRDGNAPVGGLTMDATGALFGTTLLGGDAAACGQSGSGFVGCGTAFELKPSGSSYRERVLYRFQGGADGAPGSAPIMLARSLYGTAATGGGNPSCGSAPINPGCGTVYKLTPARTGYSFSLIYTFTGAPSDGANAFGGLVVNRGRFYGTTQYGGAKNQGAAFSLTPSGSKYTETTLHSFGGGNDGSYPLAGVALGSGGQLYGTTQYGGGSANAGIIFELRPLGSGYHERVLHRFDTIAGGENPIGGVFLQSRHLYGTTSYGGNASAAGGTVFRTVVK